MTRKLGIVLAAIAATTVCVALYSMTTLAGEVHLDFPTFARMNVTDDPNGYAPAIAMPTKIELRVVIDNEDIEITGDPPWVDVAGSYDGEEILAGGSGTVLGIAGVDVSFEGKLNEGILTGTYVMGTDLALPMVDGESAPIEYTLKPNVEPPPTPTNTATPTPTFTPTFTPTNTSPAPAATPTNTSPPPATSTPTMTPTNTAGPTSTPVEPTRDGDLNKDGVTNSLDALFVLQHVAGVLVSLPNEARADVNGDGIVNVLDAQLMLQYGAGFLDSLPVA